MLKLFKKSKLSFADKNNNNDLKRKNYNVIHGRKKICSLRAKKKKLFLCSDVITKTFLHDTNIFCALHSGLSEFESRTSAARYSSQKAKRQEAEHENMVSTWYYYWSTHNRRSVAPHLNFPFMTSFGNQSEVTGSCDCRLICYYLWFESASGRSVHVFCTGW